MERGHINVAYLLLHLIVLHPVHTTHLCHLPVLQRKTFVFVTVMSTVILVANNEQHRGSRISRSTCWSKYLWRVLSVETESGTMGTLGLRWLTWRSTQRRHALLAFSSISCIRGHGNVIVKRYANHVLWQGRESTGGGNLSNCSNQAYLMCFLQDRLQ